MLSMKVSWNAGLDIADTVMVDARLSIGDKRSACSELNDEHAKAASPELSPSSRPPHSYLCSSCSRANKQTSL